MSIFSFPQTEVLTSYRFEGERAYRAAEDAQSNGVSPPLYTDSGSLPDLSDQFLVFQLSAQSEGPTILESSEVEPSITGSAEQPDVLAVLELVSFQVGADEGLGEHTCATMRMNFGKDNSSTDKRFDTVFWSIAAGLRLYDQATNKRSEGKDLKGDFHRAFGNRPIEIPGGLGRLSFEVIEHKEPPWWKKLLGFGQSDTSKQLVSLLGFPAITTQAISVIDELLERLSDSKPRVLFRSLPMRLALSKWAREQFTGGNPKVRMGGLSPGLCVMARGRDFKTIAETNSFYYPQYGKLVPSDVSQGDLVSGQYEDPFGEMTYAVFRVGMKDSKIDPTFNF